MIKIRVEYHCGSVLDFIVPGDLTMDQIWEFISKAGAVKRWEVLI